MTTITIPRKLIKERNLILIPRKEYEDLLRIASKKSYTGLDKELDKAIAEYRAGNFLGPFNTAREGITAWKSRKTSRGNK